MPTADQVLALARAAWRGDTAQSQSLIRQLHAAAPERSRLRTALNHILLRPGPPPNGTAAPFAPLGGNPEDGALPREIQGCVDCPPVTRDWDSLVLPEALVATLREWVAETDGAPALARYGLSPRHRLLLSGPPGTGKTTCAEVLAHALGRPLLVVQYGRLIDSHLGETGRNLAQLFAALPTMGDCVLLVDEMETLLSERGGKEDVGEMVRIVSLFLMAIDRLPPSVLLIGTTNHPDLLDRAVHRRFDNVLDFPATLSPPAILQLAQGLARRYPSVPFPDWVDEIPPQQTAAAVEQRLLARARAWALGQSPQTEPGEPTGRARGGYARAAALTPERRTEIARKAGNARWTPGSVVQGECEDGSVGGH